MNGYASAAHLHAQTDIAGTQQMHAQTDEAVPMLFHSIHLVSAVPIACGVAGLELFGDLVLADFLVEADLATEVSGLS